MSSVTLQLAGDLISESHSGSILATAFNVFIPTKHGGWGILVSGRVFWCGGIIGGGIRQVQLGQGPLWGLDCGLRQMSIQ